MDGRQAAERYQAIFGAPRGTTPKATERRRRALRLVVG